LSTYAATSLTVEHSTDGQQSRPTRKFHKTAQYTGSSFKNGISRTSELTGKWRLLADCRLVNHHEQSFRAAPRQLMSDCKATFTREVLTSEDSNGNGKSNWSIMTRLFPAENSSANGRAKQY